MSNNNYQSCPNCGFQPGYSAIGREQWPLYRCDDCGKKFCSKCPGTNGGAECPRDGEHNFSEFGTIWGT